MLNARARGREGARARGREGATFNPLFIGEVFQPLRPRAFALNGVRFQSPLHRGSLFNSALNHGQHLLRSVSIPSSSGRSLQQTPGDLSLSFAQTFQSPLHRGGLFNLFKVKSFLFLLVSQSPLHRGGLFNLLSGSSSKEGSACLNPLFIGEVSSTLFLLWHLFLPFFVSFPSSSGSSLQRRILAQVTPAISCLNPLFIGEVSSTDDDIADELDIPDVSIPSSSGKSLQHRTNSARHLAGSCLNPLFIGEVSSTLAAAKEEKALNPVSIPSSSGESLQPVGNTTASIEWRMYQSALHRGSLFNRMSSKDKRVRPKVQ